MMISLCSRHCFSWSLPFIRALWAGQNYYRIGVSAGVGHGAVSFWVVAPDRVVVLPDIVGANAVYTYASLSVKSKTS